VLAVVDLHGHFVDVGFKGVVRIRQRRKLVLRHGKPLLDV